jgi:hypothetical protein
MPIEGEHALAPFSVFCADVGSIKNEKFGWAASFADGTRKSGASIEDFALAIAQELSKGRKVAIGFECPLFVPIRADPMLVNSARNGEGNRSWSAGAGTGALATGLVEVLWTLNAVARHSARRPRATFDWAEFQEEDCVFLWEAFVTSTAKGTSHFHDAQIAVEAFRDALPNPQEKNAIKEAEVLSLVGAAALRAGWATDSETLSEQCIVIKA